DEHFKKEAWESAFDENGLTVEQFANRRIGLEEPLPWGHMDAVVTHEYLKREHERAYEAVVTPDCRRGCNGCFGKRCAEFCGNRGAKQ
ncbi:MAG: B12-binding domain-containing radical SAM protein, partial [Clostridia bacterium]|nr:B12-binding domain-containing radical SAM protein [Clostridia bacterium]